MASIISRLFNKRKKRNLSKLQECDVINEKLVQEHFTQPEKHLSYLLMDVKQRGTSVPATEKMFEMKEENIEKIIGLDNKDTLVVMEFAEDCPEETKDWLERLILAPNGADLQVKGALNPELKKTFHLSATEERFIRGAEQLRMKKINKENQLCEVKKENMEDFKHIDENSNLPMLNSADKQRIIIEALHNMKAGKEETIPGYSDKKIYSGQAIIPFLKAYGIISQIFPLHDRKALKQLNNKWYKSLTWWQPIDAIRDYYGSTIAIYFAFLEYYTLALIPPVALVFLFSMINTDETWKNLIFALINVLWGTVFLEFWKGKCTTTLHRWGTLKQSLAEVKDQEPRPLYYGDTRTSPITGKKEIYYPESHRYLKICFVSAPIVALSIYIAISVMGFFVGIQENMVETYGKQSGIKATVMTTGPSILYSIIILVLNNLYLRTATKLTDFENHKLESSYQNYLIVKLIMFFFVNNFYSLFHMAFVLQDMDLLKTHLAALVITQQLTGQVTEQVLPYILYKTRTTKIKKGGITSVNTQDDIEYQTKQEPYWGVFWDYLEMFLQFGYVFLFSSVYPMAAFWALFNNICELRTDAFKISKLSQRPFAEPSDGIGAWQAAFEIMSILAVMTNCALVAMSPVVKDWLPTNFSTVNTVLVFVAVEHVLLAVKFFMALIIPDVPGWIEEEFARKDYLEKEALTQKEQKLGQGEL